jgi:hypothetical protein
MHLFTLTNVIKENYIVSSIIILFLYRKILRGSTLLRVRADLLTYSTPVQARLVIYAVIVWDSNAPHSKGTIYVSNFYEDCCNVVK